MSVEEGVEGREPRGGTIYTSPSTSELGISPDGRLTLRSPVEGKPQRIDHLFASASLARAARVIAVVLSGTGTDGAVGSLVVKFSGGTVIAESMESAQHPGMPTAAARAGAVDATLPAGEIASLLVELARGGLDEASMATKAILDEIVAAVSEPGGTDFAAYRLGTLRRRAEKRRALLGLTTLAEYRDIVLAEPEERAAFVKSLLVPVTEFFRDPAAWQSLETSVLPQLVRSAEDGKMRIWCAGCASGEEAYSLAILMAENVDDPSLVEIVATDLDPDALDQAKKGVYDPSRLANVDATRRHRFFAAEGPSFRVNDEIRGMVRFEHHDVTREPIPGPFDLIVCRNVLIYFEDDLQDRTIEVFRQSLRDDGVLFLGRSEAVPDDHEYFEPIVRAMRLFRASRSVPGRKFERRDSLHKPRAAASEPEDPRANEPSEFASTIRVEEPDAFILALDRSWRITSANARAAALLDEDVVGQRILDLFPSWQGSPVQDALRAAVPEGRSLKVRGAPTPWGRMDIRIESLLGPPGGSLLIGTPTMSTWMRPLAEARDMEEDLAVTNEEVQSANEELAATNEELQAANEELAATNEELQAANEELATLNEELQGTNESLTATNVAIEAAASGSRPASELMREILEARPDAIIACDAAKRVTLFTPQAATLFGLESTSVGMQLPVRALAPPGAAFDELLVAAIQGPVKRRVEHAGRELDLSIQHIANRAGRHLGWMIAWTEHWPAE